MSNLESASIPVKLKQTLKQGRVVNVKKCDNNIRSTLKITSEMIKLAIKGDADREDVGCGILYGILLDSAHRIKKIAEQEKDAHIAKGWWKEK